MRQKPESYKRVSLLLLVAKAEVGFSDFDDGSGARAIHKVHEKKNKFWRLANISPVPDLPPIKFHLGKLDAIMAEKVIGWKNVHRHKDRGGLYGQRQDKLGHRRIAKVPSYSTNPLHAYSIEARMKQLGRLDRYHKELSKITRAKDILSDSTKIFQSKEA